MVEPGTREPGTGQSGAAPGPGGSHQPVDGEPASILFVCTANRIRSAFAEVVAREIAADRGIEIAVASAGFDMGGLPAMETMAKVAAASGLDLTDHVSTQLDANIIDASDLVLTMTGTHVVDLTALFPRAVSRTATLREAAASAEKSGAPMWSRVGMREWATELTDRPLEVLLGGNVDIADPVGRSKRIHKRTATIIRVLLDQLLVPAN